MRCPEYNITTFGERSILIKVRQQPSTELLQWLLEKKQLLSTALEVEVVQTYDELLLKNVCTHNTNEFVEREIQNILGKPVAYKKSSNVIHKIPVCYNILYAPDLRPYSEAVGLSISQIIELHTAVIYTVYFVGFLPGFPYLDGLNKRLYLPRKETPSRNIVAGSIAIGGEQTGIYPQESPGGWHCIGRTPSLVFNVTKEPAAIFKAGDRILFYEITPAQFEQTKTQLKKV